MKKFSVGDLKINAEEKNGKVFMTWVGKSREREPSTALNPYLETILSQLEGKPIEINFTKLEYMNSSTVPPIIKFVKDLDNNNIRTVIYYNKTSEWQSASFKALGAIAQTLENINVEGK